MINESTQDGLQTPGEVSLEELLLISSSGVTVSLLDYFIELNIYESIFSSVITGEIVLSDSANLIRHFPITGEESLIVYAKTPGYPSTEQYVISKTFRVFSVEDRVLARDQNTQVYKLKFISQEALVDSATPLFNSFKGKINDVVSKIFNTYVSVDRNLTYSNKSFSNGAKTQLFLLGTADNYVKFVSTGWSPIKCINWLAKKAIPIEGAACNFLFWESNKSFYFGSIETLFLKGSSIGTYRYSPTSVSVGTDDIAEKMTLITDLKILNGLDHVVGIDSGYFASKLISLNLYNKKQEVTAYDHTKEYKKYIHSTFKNPTPLFNPDSVLKDVNTHIRVYPKYPNLHTDAKKNINERMGEIYSNRLSNIKELDNLKLNIIVHGRTDVEAGQMIDITFPDMEPPSEDDMSQDKFDPKYSGRYLITAINHKINIFRHSMSMEVIKDSFDPDSQNIVDYNNAQG